MEPGYPEPGSLTLARSADLSQDGVRRTRKVDIGKPDTEREIEVRPVEEPVPSPAPAERPVPSEQPVPA